MVSELKLDHLFWEAISSNPSFQVWFLSRTKFVGRDLNLVTNEKWHQRWYKDPETGKESETDILLIFLDRATSDHGMWRKGQAEQYRRRALNRMLPWRYVDFQTALIAPTLFIARWPLEVGHFDVTVSYEDISAFVPTFNAHG
jgi:hypothetical protein